MKKKKVSIMKKCKNSACNKYFGTEKEYQAYCGSCSYAFNMGFQGALRRNNESTKIL